MASRDQQHPPPLAPRPTRKPTVIPAHPGCINWSDISTDSSSRFRFSEAHAAFCGLVHVFELQDGHELYGLVRIWRMSSDADHRLRLFETLRADTALMSELRVPRTARDILVVAPDSQPLGYFAAMIASRPDRLRGLFVAAFGHRNCVPCEHCESTFIGSRMSGTDNSTSAHVRYPFVECVSVPGLYSGQCANCLYHVRSSCSFKLNLADPHPLISAVQAIDEDSDDGTVFSNGSGNGYFRDGERRLLPRPDFRAGDQVQPDLAAEIQLRVHAEARRVRFTRDPDSVIQRLVQMVRWFDSPEKKDEERKGEKKKRRGAREEEEGDW